MTDHYVVLDPILSMQVRCSSREECGAWGVEGDFCSIVSRIEDGIADLEIVLPYGIHLVEGGWDGEVFTLTSTVQIEQSPTQKMGLCPCGCGDLAQPSDVTQIEKSSGHKTNVCPCGCGVSSESSLVDLMGIANLTKSQAEKILGKPSSGTGSESTHD